MTSMEQDRHRPRRSFTPEFKADIVERCRRGDRSIGQVARDFDLTETAVRAWVHQADVDAGQRDGLTTAERGNSPNSAARTGGCTRTSRFSNARRLSS